MLSILVSHNQLFHIFELGQSHRVLINVVVKEKNCQVNFESPYKKMHACCTH